MSDVRARCCSGCWAEIYSQHKAVYEELYVSPVKQQTHDGDTGEKQMRCIHYGAGYIWFLQLFHYLDQDNLTDCQIILEAMNFSYQD